MVPLNISRQGLPMLLALSVSLALSCIPLFASVAHAKVLTDTDSPVIELEPLEESTADRSQVFTALVADDGQLKDVTLYHRRAGQQAFFTAPMQPLGSSGYYSASIKTDPTDTRSIEYYLQARDESGNRTISGYAFDPYRRELAPQPMLIRPAVASPVVSTRHSKQAGSGSHATRWWAVALSVLAVGALTSLVNAESNGTGGDSGNDSIGVPVTFSIQRP